MIALATLILIVGVMVAVMGLYAILTARQQRKDIQQIMAGISDIQTAQSAEKADLVTLTGLITSLLAAFASGAMTPAQAQAVLDEVNSEDSTIKTSITTIQAALPPSA